MLSARIEQALLPVQRNRTLNARSVMRGNLCGAARREIGDYWRAYIGTSAGGLTGAKGEFRSKKVGRNVFAQLAYPLTRYFRRFSGRNLRRIGGPRGTACIAQAVDYPSRLARRRVEFVCFLAQITQLLIRP